MNKLRGGFCDVDVILKWVCIGIFGSMVIFAIVNRCLEAFTESGRNEQMSKRVQSHENVYRQCDVCHRMSSSTFFCSVCGTVCDGCLPSCYQRHPASIQ